MKFTIYQGSRQGPRPYNQDRLAYSYSKDALMMVIADGMGGHRHGEVAAQLAVKMLTDAFQKTAKPELSSPSRFLNEQILEIHEAIDDIRKNNSLAEAPRTTIAAAIVQRDFIHIAHVGDSRLYHYRNRELLYRTEDHSVVQMMLRKGQITKKDLGTHPDRHKIYNCLGGTTRPQVHISQKRQLKDGDRILLCTDGLWTAVSDIDISRTLHAGAINLAALKLLDNAETLCKKDGDNMSLIAMQWGEKQDSKTAVSTGTMPLGATTTILNPLTTYQLTVRNDEAAEAASDLSDEDIESAIAGIQAAIHKTKGK